MFAVLGLLLTFPALGAELTVADYVDLTIARLELTDTAWSEQGRSPTQAEEDDLFESWQTTAESYYGFAVKHQRKIEAHLEDNPQQRDLIQALSDAIQQRIEQAEVE